MIKVEDYGKSFKIIYKIFPDLVRWVTKVVPDKRKGKCFFKKEAVFISGIYMFLFRSKSLRAYVNEFRNNKEAMSNFNKYFTTNDIPSDDEFRYILSSIPTSAINKILQKIHQVLERKKIIQKFYFMKKYSLLALDGSGQISSYKIKCPKCLTRKSDKKETLYMHSQLVGSMVDTKNNISLTMGYEPIENDGKTTEYRKNDCELNSCKRFLNKMKLLYPKRSFCILADNLMAIKSIVEQIKSKSWHYIITAKPERNKELFSWYDYLKEKKSFLVDMDKEGICREYAWSNKLPLRQELNPENYCYVNLLEYSETKEELINGVKKNKVLYYNTWITDFKINESNVKELAEGGRSRFAIENKTFNEQKTRGYQTEHNFGHFGNLPSVFFGLAQIAHIFSQIFSLTKIGKNLTKEIGSSQRFWERYSVLFSSFYLPVDPNPILYLKLEINST